MKILVLTFYYRPDLSAGSFRTTALVDTLESLAPAGSAIDVVTTLPNRYHSFTVDAPQREQHGTVSITRIVLPAHQSGILDQSKAFLTFVAGATKAVEVRDYDLVFATSSRLMTAVLGAWIARRKKARLYLDIRDIFVDTIKDVALKTVARLTKPFFSLLERFAIRQANAVNLVSAGFAEYFRARYPAQRFSYFTNGIDEEFLQAAPFVERETPAAAADRCLTVLYGGNLGEGQGLHAIVPALAERMGSRVRFQIIGDGGRRDALVQALAATGVTNVELRPPVNRAELLELYRAADVLFLHLNDYDAFKKVLPSKIFEYAALGKPVWAGVSGYAAEFIRSEISNAAVFHPCDVAGALRAFEQLAIVDAPRTGFCAKHARASITQEMTRDILAIAADVR